MPRYAEGQTGLAIAVGACCGTAFPLVLQSIPLLASIVGGFFAGLATGLLARGSWSMGARTGAIAGLLAVAAVLSLELYVVPALSLASGNLPFIASRELVLFQATFLLLTLAIGATLGGRLSRGDRLPPCVFVGRLPPPADSAPLATNGPPSPRLQKP